MESAELRLGLACGCLIPSPGLIPPSWRALGTPEMSLLFHCGVSTPSYPHVPVSTLSLSPLPSPLGLCQAVTHWLTLLVHVDEASGCASSYILQHLELLPMLEHADGDLARLRAVLILDEDAVAPAVLTVDLLNGDGDL